MNPLKKLFQQTAIYGLATVLPRMLNFLLLPLYTGILVTAGYGEVSVIFSWIAIFNVFLAYGMETAFFRFYNKNHDKEKVVSTSMVSIAVSTLLFTVIALLFQGKMASAAEIGLPFIRYAIAIIALDAFVIIPFAWLRANEKPMNYV